jgi:SAM-dependent methyltransferase
MLLEVPESYIPVDHCKQVTAEKCAIALMRQLRNSFRVLDLGCGSGGSIDFFKLHAPEAKWVGLDIEDSPEVRSRCRTDGEFHIFDGVHIPFENSSFDLVYCKQVLEHVKSPEILLKEVQRVLRPGGHLVGSTSHLEPYHSYSYQNFTPFGFCALALDANLQILEIRPGIDGLTLTFRRGLGAPGFMNRWFENESPLNRLIAIIGFLMKRGIAWRNQAKLLFCGHFCFLLRNKV